VAVPDVFVVNSWLVASLNWMDLTVFIWITSSVLQIRPWTV